MNICNNCGCETRNPKYCSKSCAAKVNGKEFPKRQVERSCTKCDMKARNYRSKLCEFHFTEYKNRATVHATIGDYRK